MTRVAITVPCYNEAQRFRSPEFERLLGDPRIDLVLVNDGSTDETARVLEALRAIAPQRVEILALERNSGKSEAVRRGMVRSLDGAADVAGFADADLATPVDEILRMVEVICETDAQAVIASRRAGQGIDIERRWIRRALGRAFSLAGSAALRRWVHDTQCGAKLFRRSDALLEALSRPFRSRWAFDVELLGKWLIGSESAGQSARLIEMPLRRWSEVPGSKLGVGSMLRAGIDLAGVAIDLQRLRRDRGRGA
jgi:glycosyltransferase involved in cell wall biosynthesis